MCLNETKIKIAKPQSGTDVSPSSPNLKTEDIKIDAFSIRKKGMNPKEFISKILTKFITYNIPTLLLNIPAITKETLSFLRAASQKHIPQTISLSDLEKKKNLKDTNSPSKSLQPRKGIAYKMTLARGFFSKKNSPFIYNLAVTDLLEDAKGLEDYGKKFSEDHKEIFLLDRSLVVLGVSYGVER